MKDPSDLCRGKADSTRGGSRRPQRKPVAEAAEADNGLGGEADNAAGKAGAVRARGVARGGEAMAGQKRCGGASSRPAWATSMSSSSKPA